jgi:DNA-nicking Smr family endonuclease
MPQSHGNRTTPMSNEPDQEGDESQLFRDEIGDVRPLRQDRAAPFRRKRSPHPLPRQEQPWEEDEADRDRYSEHEIETPEFLEFSRPGVQNRLLRELRRGHLEIGMELDLHGLTVRYARQVLQEFLYECGRRDIRCVQIIHGKGSGSEHRQPVLKQKINLWLRQREEVLAFCSALRRDGGTGAVYVLLKHQRHRRR